MANFDSLSDSQRQIYLSYQDIMGAGDFHSTLQVLESANWDLQEAITFQLGGDDVPNAPVNPEDVPMIPLGDDDFATLPSESSSNVIASDYNEFYNTIPQSNQSMVTQFQRRHISTDEGMNLPEFFIGNLSEAIHHAFTVMKRPLLFYLENEASEYSEHFAQNILSNDLVSKFINDRYTVFLWDAGSYSSRRDLIQDLESSYMTKARVKVENIQDFTHAFPVLLAVGRDNALLEYCDSSDRVELVLDKLMDGAEIFDRVEQTRTNARHQREMVRAEQEDQYLQALEEDMRRREEQKQKEQEEKQKEQEEKRQIQEARAREIEEAIRQEQLKKTMPDEPEQNDDTVVTVRFRFPNQSEKTRKFRKTESIQTLVDFLSSDGWSSEQYNFINSERKNICDTFQLEKTFEQAVEDNEWTPRESVIVAKKSGMGSN